MYFANTVILIQKYSHADTISQFRPIALANFKFKIISKVLDDRLAQVMPYILFLRSRGGSLKGGKLKIAFV
jgi:hypothetical protein